MAILITATVTVNNRTPAEVLALGRKFMARFDVPNASTATAAELQAFLNKHFREVLVQGIKEQLDRERVIAAKLAAEQESDDVEIDAGDTIPLEEP